MAPSDFNSLGLGESFAILHCTGGGFVPNLEQILEALYGNGLNEKDFAMIIRRIHQSLDDSFYENPPSVAQLLVLKNILTMADEVEEFYK